MTTHPVPVGTGQWQSSDLPTSAHDQLRTAARRLNEAHAPADKPALPVRQPGVALARTETIAAVHNLATFLEESADLPLPILVDSHHTVGDVLELERLAERLGCRIYGSDARPQFDLTLSRAGGTLVRLIVAVRAADRPL